MTCQDQSMWAFIAGACIPAIPLLTLLVVHELKGKAIWDKLFQFKVW